MEYIYAQTPSKSQARQDQNGSMSQAQARGRGSKSTRAFDPYADVIDLTTEDSPLPRARNTGGSSSSRPPPVYNGRPSSSTTPPLSSSSSHNRPKQYNNSWSTASVPAASVDSYSSNTFGASIAKPKSNGRGLAPGTPKSKGSMSKYIRPSTGAFGNQSDTSVFNRATTSGGYRADGWPAWVDEHSAAAKTSGPIGRGKDYTYTASGGSSKRSSDDEGGEDFDIGAAQFTAKDFETCTGDPEEQMRELLAGAVGDGEEGVEDEQEIVEGFAPHIKLMPHQVRGVRWMRERETGRRNGGILADDMGLGKTVQTLARIVDGRHTAVEKKTYKGGTLIICPLAVMEQWAEEVRTKTKKGLLTVTTHHGPRRAKLAKELLDYDVVITTFQVAASEFGVKEGTAKPTKSAPVSDSDSDSDAASKRRRAKKKPSTAQRSAPLFDIKWLRIVVDEAQNIKNHKTKAAMAASELNAKYRWCLTGTPIQNSVEELYSLFKFLRARPLDNWGSFRERILSEVKAGRTGVAMKRLHVILKAIMLRRTKTATIDGKSILNLPQRNVEVVECPFDGDERSFYDALEQRTALTFNKFLRNGTAMSNYTDVLSMLLRLRQACCHPSLVTKALAEAVEDDPTGTADVEDELAGLMSGLGVAAERKCEVCFAVLKNQDSDGSKCPECSEITAGKKRVGKGLPPSSAKIRKMMELLVAVKGRSDGKEKTIVFSQFTSFLNLLEPFLKEEGIGYVRYDGTLRNDERIKVLDAIKTNDDKTVILISFKAGSTGLNLTCCNNVILMDLWWNPALEDQAFDRAHRLGQTRDVNIWKLTVEQTVEDRILSLQTEKRELADAALSGTAVKNMKLTMTDILKLFQRSTD